VTELSLTLPRVKARARRRVRRPRRPSRLEVLLLLLCAANCVCVVVNLGGRHYLDGAANLATACFCWRQYLAASGRRTRLSLPAAAVAAAGCLGLLFLGMVWW
jgi:hypothetical protein